MLPQLNNYFDLLQKLDYDLGRYKNNNDVYGLLDCLMDLSALPEWIENSNEASEALRDLAGEKISIMQGKNFTFKEDKLDVDINQKLRFIRMTCNHAKHKNAGREIPVIKKFAGSFPYSLPFKFGTYIVIGSKEIDAEILINDVAAFWKNEIFK